MGEEDKLSVKVDLSLPLGLLINPSDLSVGKVSGQALKLGVVPGCKLVAVGELNVPVSSFGDFKHKIKTLKGVQRFAAISFEDPRPGRRRRAAEARQRAIEAANSVEAAAAAAIEAAEAATETERIAREQKAAALAAVEATVAAKKKATAAKGARVAAEEQKSACLKAARSERLAIRSKELSLAREAWRTEKARTVSALQSPHSSVTVGEVRITALQGHEKDSGFIAVLAEVVHLLDCSPLSPQPQKYRTRAETQSYEMTQHSATSEIISTELDDAKALWLWNDVVHFKDISLPPTALALRVTVIREIIRLDGEKRTRVKSFEPIGQIIVPLSSYSTEAACDGAAAQSAAKNQIWTTAMSDFKGGIGAPATDRWYDVDGIKKRGPKSNSAMPPMMLLLRISFSRLYSFSCAVCSRRNVKRAIPRCFMCTASSGRPPLNHISWSDRKAAATNKMAFMTRRRVVNEKIQGVAKHMRKSILTYVIERKEPPPPWINTESRRQKQEATKKGKEKAGDQLSLPRLLPSNLHQVKKEDEVFQKKSKKKSSLAPAETTERQLRRCRPRKVDIGAVNRVHSKLKAALYGTDLSALMRRYDHNRSGTLDHHELRQMMRASLKIPLTLLSDEDIDSFVEALDEDASGELDQDEIEDFVKRGSASLTDVLTMKT